MPAMWLPVLLSPTTMAHVSSSFNTVVKTAGSFSSRSLVTPYKGADLNLLPSENFRAHLSMAKN